MKRLTFVFLVLASACAAQTTKPVKTFPVVEKAVFDTINNYRVKNGLKKPEVDNIVVLSLYKVANIKV